MANLLGKVSPWPDEGSEVKPKRSPEELLAKFFGTRSEPTSGEDPDANQG